MVLCLHRPYISEHCRCILKVRHILVGCNHLAQTKKDILGSRDVVELFRMNECLTTNQHKKISAIGSQTNGMDIKS